MVWGVGAYCGKNRHSKDKRDPAVTLPDSGGLSAHSDNELIAAMRMY